MKSAPITISSDTTHKPCLCVVVALPVEAKAMTASHNLHPCHDKHYRILSNESSDLYVIVSGVGRLNAACAVAYFCGRYHPAPSFLNFGIAGSQQHAVGELLAVNKIHDSASERRYYPDFSWQQPIASATCVTRERYEPSYPATGCVDLEAAGFYMSANRFIDREGIRLLKLVSDSSTEAVQQLDKTRVAALIKAQQSAINRRVAEQWEQATACVPFHNDLYERFIQEHHFTEYQRHQLFEYTRRYRALYPTDELLVRMPSAKHLLDYLIQTCEQCGE